MSSDLVVVGRIGRERAAISHHSRESPSTARPSGGEGRIRTVGDTGHFLPRVEPRDGEPFRRYNLNTSLSLGLNDEVNATRFSCITETVVTERRIVARRAVCKHQKCPVNRGAPMTDPPSYFPEMGDGLITDDITGVHGRFRFD